MMSKRFQVRHFLTVLPASFTVERILCSMAMKPVNFPLQCIRTDSSVVSQRINWEYYLESVHKVSPSVMPDLIRHPEVLGL